MEQPWVLPQRAERENPAIIKGDPQLEREVWVVAGQVLVEMHVTNWAAAQKEDPELNAVLQWLVSRKKADLRMLLGECIMSEEGLDGVEESPELHFPPRYPLLVLHPPKGTMRICYYS